ncbi:MBOAT family O-acyltransferase [Paenibacillus protaetiae]|uniref:MBOAT family protein n=1 Tax=Paenibacillus protaetiae TaxID=2509456 RepID=A0A4P6ER99_9BACL|nr:MBOAT family O-acyltransferase [Paenibacillus protaetiae]QAY65394.1 MBOAT family protein [Paenibacillus protaetiae]
MLFNSLTFLVFLTVVFAAYYLLPRARIVWIGIANAVFYAYAGTGYFVLFASVVTVVYILSKALGGRLRKPALAAGLTVVLGNLFFFKYSLFAVSSLEDAFGFSMPGGFGEHSLVLPIGISFYSFQLIAYLVDVYKGKLQSSRSWLEFWVFISFFAHSAAGPILRGGDFLPQLRRINGKTWNSARFKLGLAYLLMGLAKKLVIVELIVPHVNEYYKHAGALNGVEAWYATYLFAFQIYYDFSAYSEMAVGIGYLLGLRLDLNFRTPYLSANPTEFWRRWHITLSQWIRDYIYIPLGGSRVKEWRIYFNLIAAMTISGLWHGAAWTFILWGLYHGLLQAVHRYYAKLVKKFGWTRLYSSKLYRAAAVALFFHMTVIGWVFFRAGSLADALHMIKQMLLFTGVEPSPRVWKFVLVAGCFYLLHFAEHLIVSWFKRLSLAWQTGIPFWLRGAVYAAVAAALLLLLTNGKASSFIYFQF